MVTMNDIAKELALSRSVVSRVLNPAPDSNARVAEETRMRVLEAAKRMGYRHNRSAEFMKRNRSATIGVFIPDMPNSLTANLLFGISEEANKHGFPISIHTGICVESYMQFIRESCRQASSGIITYSVTQYRHPELEAVLDEYESKGGKVLILNNTSMPERVNLSMNETHGGRLAAQVLLGCDCDKYCCQNFGEPSQSNYLSTLRKKGFEKELKYRGKKAHFYNDFHEVFELIKNNRREQYGIFATTDFVALTYIEYGRKYNLVPGQDYKIVGYDDIDFGGNITHGLTTIRQPFREQGHLAIKMQIEMIYGKKQCNKLINPEIVRRNTA